MWRRFRWGSAKGTVIMNTIIERLSQIEERSVAAAEGTEKKKELTAQYEERTRQFDRGTGPGNRRKDPEAPGTGGCRRQRPHPVPGKKAAQSIQQLERHYDAFHKDYVDRLFRGNDRGVVYGKSYDIQRRFGQDPCHAGPVSYRHRFFPSWPFRTAYPRRWKR